MGVTKHLLTGMTLQVVDVLGSKKLSLTEFFFAYRWKFQGVFLVLEAVGFRVQMNEMGWELSTWMSEEVSKRLVSGL